MAKKAFVTGACVCAAILAADLPAGEGMHIHENELCKRIEECYRNLKSLEKDRGAVFDIYVERLSFLVLAAGTHSSGSPCLDQVFAGIQKELPTVVVPRFVMAPADLKKFIDDVATDDSRELTYSAYRKKARTMSELIDDAKDAIAMRTGFKFDPSPPVIRSQ